MAKKRLNFLDKLGADSLENDALVDVIPVREGLTSRQKSEKKQSPKKKKGRKRKTFLDRFSSTVKREDIESLLPEEKKSVSNFLDRLESDNAGLLEDVIPSDQPKKKRFKGKQKPQARLSTVVEADLFERIRGIAENNNLTIKEIVNLSLKAYLQAL